jgi:hypothetical protein
MFDPSEGQLGRDFQCGYTCFDSSNCGSDDAIVDSVSMADP